MRITSFFVKNYQFTLVVVLMVVVVSVTTLLNMPRAEDPEINRRARDLRTADPVREYFRHQLLMRKTIDYLSTLAAPESSDKMESPAEAKELQGAATSPSGAAPSRERKER